MVFNQLLGIPSGVMVYNTWQKHNAASDVRELPTVQYTFFVMFVSMLLHDFAFYHGHRYHIDSSVKKWQP